MSSSRFQQTKLDFLNRCQHSTAWFSNQCSQAKTWVSNKLDTEPALKARGALNGAVKAALGVHYYFDLGMVVIPATSPWYNTIKGVKYTATGISFIVSTYRAYDKSKKSKNTQEKLNDLEEKLIQIDKMLNEAQQIFTKADDLLNTVGYGFKDDKKPSLDLNEIKENKLEAPSPTLKSKVCDLLESKPAQYTRALLDGAVKASGVHYIFDLGSEVIPNSKAYTVIKDVLIGTTFLGSALSAHGRNKTELIAREKLNQLKQKIGEALEKLKLIQKKMGSREDLIKIIQDGSKATNQEIEMAIKEHPVPQKEEEKTFFSKLAESKPAKYINAAISGAVKASGVHYIFENGVSELPAIKYIASGSTLLIASIRSFDKNIANAAYQEELKNLDDEIEETRHTILMAKKIMKLQEDFVRILQPEARPREVSAEVDELDNEILLASFNQLEESEEITGVAQDEVGEIELKELAPNDKATMPEADLTGHNKQDSSLRLFSIFKPFKVKQEDVPLLGKDRGVFYNSTSL